MLSKVRQYMLSKGNASTIMNTFNHQGFKKAIPGAVFILCVIALGTYVLVKHIDTVSQHNKVIDSINKPTACSVLEKNNMLAWLVGPDNIIPFYQVAFKNDPTTRTTSSCNVYFKQGSSTYQGVFTLNYNFYWSKENIGTPYTENNNPAYLTELQKNFYTGSVLVEPIDQSGGNAKYLSGIVAASADANLPANTDIKPAK